MSELLENISIFIITFTATAVIIHIAFNTYSHIKASQKAKRDEFLLELKWPIFRKPKK